MKEKFKIILFRLRWVISILLFLIFLYCLNAWVFFGWASGVPPISGTVLSPVYQQRSMMFLIAAIISILLAAILPFVLKRIVSKKLR